MTIAQSPTLERVAAAAERGSLEEALFLLGAVLDAQRVDDALFESTVRRLAQAATSAGAKRTAVLAWLYVGAKDEAERAAELAGDRMRVARARGNLAKAASEAEAAGWLGHAGLLLAGLGRHDEAATRFERLLERPAIEADAYVRGLVAYDLCLAWRGTNQGERAAEAMIEALRALEAAADGYETRGQRERAFDCTQVLIALGREGAFENLAEGYVNAIRILREDGLKHHAIRYLDDFVTLSRERGELHAAASAAREAADYARRLGLPYEARFRRLAADAYVAAAERGLATGLPVELAENAYVAAIDQWNTLGAYASIRATALALASLPLERRKQVRYTGLAERLRDAVDRPNPSVELPDTLRSPAAYPDVWRSDVIEFEQAGDARETMAELALDTSLARPLRRRALVAGGYARLLGPVAPEGPTAKSRLASLLGGVEAYETLGPLERLARDADPLVRAAAVGAVRKLRFKRSLGVVSDALSDSDGSVVAAAVEVMPSLAFPHAFDPLVRIHRRARTPAVRRAALAAIARIPSPEALEHLLGVLVAGEPDDRALAAQALRRSDHPDCGPMLKRALETATGGGRQRLSEVLSGRGRA
ncbi:MAG: HEAT repeat domain-containing protein [Polyangiales bacterium]